MNFQKLRPSRGSSAAGEAVVEKSGFGGSVVVIEDITLTLRVVEVVVGIEVDLWASLGF